MSCAQILAVGGGVAQALGIALVAWEILSDRHRAVAVAPQGRVYSESGLARGRAIVSGVEVGGTKSPIEERVERLEHETATFRDIVREAVEAVEDGLRQHVAQTANRIDADVYERDEALRAVLRDKLAGRLWMRWFGVVLLLVGVGLSVAAAFA